MEPNAKEEKKKKILYGVLLGVLLVLLIVFGKVFFRAHQVGGADSTTHAMEESEETHSGEMEPTTGEGESETAMEEDRSEEGSQGNGSETEMEETQEESTEEVTEEETEDSLAEEISRWGEVIAAADRKAMQYDYDGAIALLESQDGYDSSVLLKSRVEEYRQTKASCVENTPDMVAHVFTHSLVVDFDRAFDGDGRSYAYNKDMLTVDEFRKIIQSMYDRGFVLVSIHDMAEMGPDGKMYPKSIWLPEGKKPVVFSQDDLSYYHIYEGDGFADCLFVDENGKVKNKYTDAAGNVLVGDYDMVPIIDTFVEEHPDFSYRGRKGIVAMTGYNGLFGYRTDTDYRDRTNLLEDQRIWLEEHPEYNYEADCAAAKAVADAMKADGWEFASHSWGHISMRDADMGLMARDTYKWETRMEPILGETDIFIYAYGADIHSTGMYTSDSEKYSFLRDAGFRYFCNVDGTSLRWCQMGTDYLRQGRVNLDGYRLMTGPDKVSELFDAAEVLDPRRPRTWG